MRITGVLILALTLATASQAQAHFGMVIPSKSTVPEKQDAIVSLDVAFAHPFEGHGMDMESPKAFFVVLDGKKQDMKAAIKSQTFMGHKAWKAQYTFNRPGVYQFAVEPQPYFEPAEDCFIVHYTKAIVPAFGSEDGWDVPLGLKTEIVPLTRPFGNYAGNVFQGRVLLDGKPVSGAEIEVEHYNKAGKYKAPDDYYVTQVIKADDNGVFTYAAPWAGWWGFAALNTAPEKMDYKGTPKDMELGAVLWVEFAAPVHK